MKPSELLRAAKAKIQDPKNWCQGIMDRDVDGCQQLCAIGALWSQSADPWLELYLDRAGAELFGEKYAWAPRVNDDLGHDAVMRMYDLAIERAERDEDP